MVAAIIFILSIFLFAIACFLTVGYFVYKKRDHKEKKQKVFTSIEISSLLNIRNDYIVSLLKEISFNSNNLIATGNIIKNKDDIECYVNIPEGTFVIILSYLGKLDMIKRIKKGKSKGLV